MISRFTFVLTILVLVIASPILSPFVVGLTHYAMTGRVPQEIVYLNGCYSANE